MEGIFGKSISITCLSFKRLSHLPFYGLVAVQVEPAEGSGSSLQDGQKISRRSVKISKFGRI